MADDPFRSPKRRLARAKENLQKFDATVKAFIDSNPHTLVVEPNPDGVTETHKIAIRGVVPEEITHLASEVIEALRAVLDQAGYACALLAGVAKPKSAYFPFSDSAAELANVISGRCKNLPSDVVSLFRSFQPYKGGNDTLWALNKMANAKHTTLVPVGVMAGGMHIATMKVSGSLELLNPRWDSRKNEMAFARATAGSKLDYHIDFTFHIAFGDVPAVARQPAFEVLDGLVRITERILSATEAECRRIGLLKT